MIAFVVFKSPSEGRTHIFRSGEPMLQILILPVAADFALVPMDEEEAAEREMRGRRIHTRAALRSRPTAPGHHVRTPYSTAPIAIYFAPLKPKNARNNRHNNARLSVNCHCDGGGDGGGGGASRDGGGGGTRRLYDDDDGGGDDPALAAFYHPSRCRRGGRRRSLAAPTRWRSGPEFPIGGCRSQFYCGRGIGLDCADCGQGRGRSQKTGQFLIQGSSKNFEPVERKPVIPVAIAGFPTRCLISSASSSFGTTGGRIGVLQLLDRDEKPAKK